jgi:hypothetical protein
LLISLHFPDPVLAKQIDISSATELPASQLTPCCATNSG